MPDPKQLTDDDWKRKLTPEQFHVLRERGTEYPGTGKYLHHDAEGNYSCAACGTVVFKSDEKYETDIYSLSGWPSFADAALLDDQESAVELRDDNAHGMRRTEVVCRTCGGHLGHLFPDGSSPSGMHFCINSAALEFDGVEVDE
ncbi:MAG TPA: peptide-methionine (R)-S-oxide reductase MsrB [Candidatus Saccharimonadales bacterium]|jgi:peptide-methionine (R)-S-oxide reductase